MRPEALTMNMEDKTMEYKMGVLENEVRELKVDIKALIENTNNLKITVATLTVQVTALSAQVLKASTPGSGLICDEHRNKLVEFEKALETERTKREDLLQRFNKIYGIGLALVCIVNLMVPLIFNYLKK